MQAILCFGDSITHGRGVMPNFGWVYYLKKWFEKKGKWHIVYNLGVPGDTSYDLLSRFKSEASARINHKYEEDKFTILLAIGMNDARWIGHPDKKNPQMSKRKFLLYVGKLIKQAKKFNASVAIIGTSPVDESKSLLWETNCYENARLAEFNDALQDASVTADIPFLDMLSLMVPQDYEGMISDGVHPNTKGYKFMFEQVKHFLVDSKLI